MDTRQGWQWEATVSGWTEYVDVHRSRRKPLWTSFHRKFQQKRQNSKSPIHTDLDRLECDSIILRAASSHYCTRKVQRGGDSGNWSKSNFDPLNTKNIRAIVLWWPVTSTIKELSLNRCLIRYLHCRQCPTHGVILCQTWCRESTMANIVAKSRIIEWKEAIEWWCAPKWEA